MKKILTVIILCLLSNVLSAYAEDGEQSGVDIAQSGYADDIELAINLGLTEGYDAVYDIYSEITRAEFSVLCANLLNNSSFTSRDQVFKDVDGYMNEYTDISQLYALGYIYGVGEGYFKPDDPITINDAASIMLRIAGYNMPADAPGAEAMKSRGKSKLTDGVASQNGYLTNGNAIRMLINALDMNVLEVQFTGAGMELVINNEKTVMNEFLKIYKLRGQLTATQYINILGGSEMAEGKICFAGEELRSYDYDDYIGYYGTCYYRENEWEKDEYDVLFIKPDSSRNVVRTVWAEDIISYTPYTFKYYKTESLQERLSLSRDTIFVYNDVMVEELTDELLIISNGYINFLDSDGDRVYDLVKIYEYENMVVDSFSSDVIYSKYDQSQNININDYEKIDIYDESGKKITAEAIGVDNVISIYKSLSAKYTQERIKLVVSSQTVAGTISEIDTDNGETFVTIDGVRYKVYGNYQSTPPKNIEMGDKGTYMLDANRLIVSVVSVVNDKYKPAYVIKVKNYCEDESEYDIQIKALYSDLGYKTISVSKKKVMVDGIMYKSRDYKEAFEKLSAAAPGVVMVKTSDEGVITAVDTLTSNVGILSDGQRVYDLDDCLRRGTSVSGARYKSETMIFEGKCSIDDGTIVFVIPNDVENAEENQFMVSNSKYFSNDTSYDFTPYYLNSAKVSADIAVIQGANAGVGFNSKIGVVTKVINGYNEAEGTGAQSYTVNVFGAEETWLNKNETVAENLYKITLGSATTDDTIEPIEGEYKIKKGDIIKCSFDENGNVTKVVLIYSARNDKMISVNPSVGDFHSPGYRYAMGKVKRKSGKIIELELDDGTLEYHAVGNKPIMLINPEYGEAVETGTFADIRIGDEMMSINRGGNTVCSYIVR